MVFAGALNDYAVRRAEGYLAWKWGSQSRLVSGHPFKTQRPVFGGDQNITVAANNLAIDLSDNLPFTSKFDDPFELEGSYATSGLDLVYTTSNASVMTVTGGKLDPVAAGTVTVYLNHPVTLISPRPLKSPFKSRSWTSVLKPLPLLNQRSKAVLIFLNSMPLRIPVCP